VLQLGSQYQEVLAVRSQLAQKLIEEFGLLLATNGRRLSLYLQLPKLFIG
jgi:hypothetical protein